MEHSDSKGLKEQICGIISSSNKFLITCHKNPDGDAIGSALGLWHLLRGIKKNATVWVPDGIPEYVKFLEGAEEVLKEISSEERFDVTIAVDAADESILAQPLPPKHRSGTIIVIDHHATHSKWGDIYYYEDAGAVGEIIFKLAELLGFNFTPAFAECIFVSIMTDTGSFRYENATPEIFKLAARCIEIGISPWKISRFVYESYPLSKLMLLNEVLSTLKIDLQGTFASICTSHSTLKKYGLGPDALEEFVNYPRGITGVEVAALLRRREDDTIRVSLRSTGMVDVSKVARAFGGGGHKAASGCTFPSDETFDSVREKIKEYLIKVYGLPQTAKTKKLMNFDKKPDCV